MTQLNKFSSRITQPRSQAMLCATGLTTEDMNKAQVGIASVWYEGNSCNMHLTIGDFQSVRSASEGCVTDE